MFKIPNSNIIKVKETPFPSFDVSDFNNSSKLFLDSQVKAAEIVYGMSPERDPDSMVNVVALDSKQNQVLITFAVQFGDTTKARMEDMARLGLYLTSSGYTMEVATILNLAWVVSTNLSKEEATKIIPSEHPDRFEAVAISQAQLDGNVQHVLIRTNRKDGKGEFNFGEPEYTKVDNPADSPIISALWVSHAMAIKMNLFGNTPGHGEEKEDSGDYNSSLGEVNLN